MAVYRRSSRTRNLIAVLVLAALTIVTIDARAGNGGVFNSARSHFSDAFAPLQRATHAALAPIGNFLTGAAEYGSLRAENQRLRQQVAALQAQGTSAAAAEARAEQVLQEQGLPFVGSIPTVTAPIIDDGSSNFDVSVTIGKGTTSGIAVGQPVVAAAGLVGSISSASAHTATISLLTDPTFDVGVTLAGGNVGSAGGSGYNRPLRVTVDTTNLPAPQMSKGQQVVTSGLAMERFPPGIPVGKVVNASLPAGASEPDIEIAPDVDATRLAYVQVLLWAPPAP